ncbi:AAA family ATPase [Lysobacter sp. A421]
MNEAIATSKITYLSELGLTRSPFPPTPDADGYFHTVALERELAEATHCLLARKGFVLMTGEVGMGKSTFVRRLLDAVVREGALASLVFNTFLQGPDLLAAILRDFGIEPGSDAADNINRLNSFLVRRWQADTTCVLVIDDAQNLSLESLELLRLLSNLESGQEKLLQIVLAGQPELDEHLGRHEIRQLTSRIVKHIRMSALDVTETARYVEFRLSLAGAAGRIRVTAAAHAALYRSSAGNPRRIHLIMDRCLYGIVATGNPVIDADLIRLASAEAGFMPVRRRHLRGPIVAAALVAATGLATAAGFVYHRDTAPAVASTTTNAESTTAATAVIADAKYVSSGQTLSACMARLSVTTTGDGALMQLIPVPDTHLGALQSRDDVCVQRRGRHWVAAWQPWLAAEELLPGQRSPSVRRLQAALLADEARPDSGNGALADGAPVDAVLADGLFGPHTRDALARFQHRHGLVATGRPDPLTLLLLKGAPAAAALPQLATTNPTPPTLSVESPENLHGNG